MSFGSANQVIHFLSSAPAVVLGCVLTGFALVLIVTGAINFRKGRASRHWLMTNGQIINSALVPGATDDPAFGVVPVSVARLRYSYEVGGRTYEGRRVFYGDAEEAGSSEAKREVRTYPAGSRVTVYYDPSRPDRAVLERGHWHSAVAQIVLGLFFLVFGVAALSIKL